MLVTLKTTADKGTATMMTDEQLSNFLRELVRQSWGLIYGLGIGAAFLAAVSFVTFRAVVWWYGI